VKVIEGKLDRICKLTNRNLSRKVVEERLVNQAPRTRRVNGRGKDARIARLEIASRLPFSPAATTSLRLHLKGANVVASWALARVGSGGPDAPQETAHTVEDGIGCWSRHALRAPEWLCLRSAFRLRRWCALILFGGGIAG
jgi:hypothetical protein